MRRLIASAYALVLSSAALCAFAADSGEVAAALADIAKLRASGDAAGAAKAAGDLVVKHPESLDAHIVRQDAELALGHDKEMLDSYRASAAAAGAGADAHFLLARLLRGGQAVTEYRAALTADPQHFWSMCGVAAELTKLKNYNDARAALDDAAKLRPDSAVPLNGYGRVDEARGKFADAEKWYRSAIEKDADFTTARVNLGAVLVAEGKAPDAVKFLQDAVQRAPKDPFPLLGLGQAYMATKDFKMAADSFRRAAVLDGDDLMTLNMLANAYIDGEQTELAEEVLQRALKKAPNHSTTNVSIAHLRVVKESYDDALKFALAAVQADDASPDAHYVLGLVYDHQVQTKKADAEFRKAERLDPESPVFARAVAALACGAGDFNAAVNEYQKVCKLTGNAVPSLMELAAALVGANKGQQAMQTYEQVLATEPNNLDALLQLGIVLHRDLKDFKRASKVFHDYVAKGGKDPRVPVWIVQLDAGGK